ncbi:hypothetical protein CYMTET_37751 [Cymbomonas tetramitiformis]|uniref:Uncharacterized protein n=1 Tax=Cymbomonas tetramitiformis TaxID=36881 RepID=A0AAE0CDB5_9CHLO|nr:hypothetical protein CYMTET_37754 [Cymbomonas tetramitiformis]KAK3252976.1 hypothetical protein CYMTET_37751 [Cymbomonas tetramitiformis]|eukprot:gene9627-11408_t
MNFLNGSVQKTDPKPNVKYGQGRPIPDALKAKTATQAPPEISHTAAQTQVFVVCSTTAYAMCAGSVLRLCNDTLDADEWDTLSRRYTLLLAADDGNFEMHAPDMKSFFQEYRQFARTKHLVRLHNVETHNRLAIELSKMIGQIVYKQNHQTSDMYAIMWLAPDLTTIEPYVKFLRGLCSNAENRVRVHSMSIEQKAVRQPKDYPPARVARTVDRDTLNGTFAKTKITELI